MAFETKFNTAEVGAAGWHDWGQRNSHHFLEGRHLRLPREWMLLHHKFAVKDQAQDGSERAFFPFWSNLKPLGTRGS